MEIEDRIAFLKMSHSFSLKAVFGLVFLQSLCRDNTDKYLSLMRKLLCHTHTKCLEQDLQN